MSAMKPANAAATTVSTIDTTASAAHAEDGAHGKALLGFWIYLMSDCVLFATLFATYAVLRHNTFGGPSGQMLFRPSFVLAETLILLTSSYSCGLALLAARRGDRRQVVALFGLTFLLGASFLGMELHEFGNLVYDGASWQRSGFLSAFFTLVGTHGAHITAGLVWIAVMLAKVWRQGETGLQAANLRRLSQLAMFWHFLDVVWIFIFTFVYLMGVLGV